MFDHFINTQESTYSLVLNELTAGAKQSHWIWYIFPQIDGLAQSDTAKYYALKNQEQALAYYNHPILGQRLIECTQLMLEIKDKSLEQIMPYPDNLKFISSMTLFNIAVPEQVIFKNSLLKFNQGNQDSRSVELIN